MFKRYEINTRPTPLAIKPVPKFNILRRDEYCLNCGRCIKSCIYEVHKRRDDDPRLMAEPEHLRCKNCYRCIQECPNQALTKIVNPHWKSMGNDYWTPQLISTLWYESETGAIPVLGAGYRGRFGGTGFEAMWTDMSEIVRPTRDGIHGREYINTSVDIGRKLPYLEFNNGDILNRLPEIIEIPVPIIFKPLPLAGQGEALQAALEQAAQELQTLTIAPEYLGGGLRRNGKPLNLHYEELPFQPGIENVVVDLVHKGVEVIHLYADRNGNEPNPASAAGPRFVRDLTRLVHLALVERGIRDEVTLIVSGGMAAAEHIPKTIICGADAVALDTALLVALGCYLCKPQRSLALTTDKQCDFAHCPAGLNQIPPEAARQRIINLVGSWRDQLLEILSAMGIREVRRLRGEAGRAMFQEDLEKEWLLETTDKHR